MTEHAPLAPSSAEQWGHCSGSVLANLQAPDTSSQRTREGEAAHWVGESVLNEWATRDGRDILCSDWIGKTAPNGVVVDEEMAEGADEWVHDVLDVCGNGHLRTIRVEQRTYAPQIHEHCWGTYDTAAFIPDWNELFVWDYKHGHREVSAHENLQLICYVAGLANEYPIDDSTVITMRIVQPYCYHATAPVWTWRVRYAELAPYIESLRVAAHRAMTEPVLTPGVHCRDCAAIGRCASARRYGYSIISYVDEPYQIETMGGPALTSERAILSDGLIVMKARLGAVEDQLRDMIGKGDRSSGLTIQNKQGRKKWNVPTGQVIAFARQFGADIGKQITLTPTQAVKLVPKAAREAFESALPTLTTQASTGVTLVPVENSRTTRAFSQKDRSGT